LHVTAEDLRGAAAKHPIGALIGIVEHLLPSARLPFRKRPPKSSVSVPARVQG
jgi:hypothetical protein